MKILITSGGCKVPIDDVRHIGNFSSGRYGAELAKAFYVANHNVIHFGEKGSAQVLYDESFDNTEGHYSFRSYKDYFEYLKVKDIIKEEQPDIIISAAAISDYIVDKTEGKISSDQDELTIKLKKGEKVIKSFRELAPNAYIVGFKLLVSPSKEETYEAIKKQISYVDMVVYNDLTKLREGKNTRYAFSQGEIPGSVNMEYVQCMSPKDLVHHIIMGRVNKTLKYSI
jgi:phosphopantothenoylcysteine decarboxylase/phosphopantothenate--cysteine ligase